MTKQTLKDEAAIGVKINNMRAFIIGTGFRGIILYSYNEDSMGTIKVFLPI